MCGCRGNGKRVSGERVEQGLTQDLETGCSKLAIVKLY